MTRPGRAGGVLVVVAPRQISLSEVSLDLKHNAALIEQRRAVPSQLEPLVLVEATKAANVDAVAELQCLIENMPAVVDQATELFGLSWCLYRHIAETSVNTVLTGIFTRY
jgi:DNA-binding FadR family transcriptional regulator